MTKLFDLEETFAEPELVEETPVVEEDIPLPTKEEILSTLGPRTRQNYFTPKGKGKIVYDLLGTSLAPSKVTMLGGKFKEKYRKQVDSVLFNELDSIDPSSLLPLLLINEYINQGAYPIRVVCSGHSNSIPHITSVLNDFYNEHKAVVDGVYRMFKQTTEIPQQEEEDGED